MPYSEVKTLGAALRALGQTRQEDAGLLFDMLHFMRGGGEVCQLAGVPAERFCFAQICDGAAQAPPPERLAEEARGARLFPGEGAFPVRAILDALPPGLALEIEIPHAKLRGRPLAEQAAVCAQRVREYLQS